MPRWKVWPSSSLPRAAQTVWLELVVRDLSGLPLHGVHDVHGSRAEVLVQWLGSGRKSNVVFRRGEIEKSSTARQPVCFDGSVRWCERFQRQCKIKKADSQSLKSWIVDLEIHVFGSISNDYTSFLAKARLDISRFASDGVEKTVGIPVKCIIRGYVAEALLTLSLRISPQKSNGGIFPPITRGLSLRSSSSGGAEFKPSVWRTLSWNAAERKILPEKEIRDEEEDGRRARSMAVPSTSSISSPPPDEDKESLPIDGGWVEKTVISRDGRMELKTDIFFASIDQRSDTVAGESACSVLATIIADWLHRNPRNLPLRRQFDGLVREGSSAWRGLCDDAANLERFSDRHFDLETVLDACLKPLKVVTEKSYVAFFAMPGQGEELIQGTMSFDQVWDELIRSEEEKERIYIAGWNDHFFVLKMEKKAIYLIDTLGERLFEGCNQAYILKFDRTSRVYSNILEEEGGGAARQLVGSGLGSCREFMKGFLAAVPLRELQAEIERGFARDDSHHRLLQIDLHYTSPL